MSSWRNSLVEETMTSRLETVLANNFPDVAHDVLFIVGDDGNEKKISCHKLLLAIASPVFEAMFSDRHSKNNKCERSGNETMTTIYIPDVDYFGLQNVIQYVYTGKFNVDISKAVVTMYAANKYLIPEIVKHCSQMLHANLSLENVVQIEKAAVDLDKFELKQRAWRFIQQNSDELLDSDQFLEFSKDNLREFLNLNFHGKSELDIFKGILRWANHQCDQQAIEGTSKTIKEILGDIILLIRFPTMSGDDFIKFVEPSGILSSEECYSIYKYLSSNELRFAISSGMLYSCQRRPRIVDALLTTSFPPGSQQDIKSVCDNLGGTINTNTDDGFSITGSTSEIKLKAVGVTLHNFTGSSEAVQIKVVVKEIENHVHRYHSLYLDDSDSDGEPLTLSTTITTKTTLSKCGEICYVELDDPMIMNRNVTYEVSASRVDQENLEGLNMIEMQTTGILNQVTCICKATKCNFTVNYTPRRKLIWALRFEY